jgi:HEPN domain-containing protein
MNEPLNHLLPVITLENGQNEELLCLTQTITAIVIEICNPDRIYLLYAGFTDSISVIPEYNFLVILPGCADKTHKTYHSLINEKCTGLASVMISFEKAGNIYKHLQAGHIFYSIVFKKSKLVYDNARLPAPPFSVIDASAIIHKARIFFEADFKKANSFLEGAKYYFSRQENNISAFLLHQAAERTLLGLLLSLSGQNHITHHLFKLLQKCRSFTSKLNRIFRLTNEKERSLLQLLNIAYINTRYRHTYKISEEDLTMLMEKVEALHDTAIQAAEEQFTEFENLYS